MDTFDLNELKAEANRGKVCIISGRNANENSSGHICAVVPENNLQKATRHADGSVRIPLQSQAGRVNKKYFNNSFGGSPEPLRTSGILFMIELSKSPKIPSFL